jgi:UPF0271 protein
LDTKEYVTDSNIFYLGIPFQSGFDFRYYITGEVFNEIKHIKKEIGGLELLLSLGKVVIRNPSLTNMTVIKNKIKTKGQFGLSASDCSIIALSFELGLPIFSKDYALINTAKLLSLKTEIPGKSGFQTMKSKKFCSICKKYYPYRNLYCNYCGNKLVYKNIV